MIDPTITLQTHASLETPTPVQTHTMLEETPASHAFDRAQRPSVSSLLTGGFSLVSLPGVSWNGGGFGCSRAQSRAQSPAVSCPRSPSPRAWAGELRTEVLAPLRSFAP